MKESLGIRIREEFFVNLKKRSIGERLYQIMLYILLT